MAELSQQSTDNVARHVRIAGHRSLMKRRVMLFFLEAFVWLEHGTCLAAKILCQDHHARSFAERTMERRRLVLS